MGELKELLVLQFLPEEQDSGNARSKQQFYNIERN